jgi:kynurenine formamidase
MSFMIPQHTQTVGSANPPVRLIHSATFDLEAAEKSAVPAALLERRRGVSSGDGEPGIGLPAARWLAEQKATLVGADNWAVEAVPPADPARPFEAHQWLLTRHGIYLLENLDLSELARDRATTFAFVFAPLRLKGATGSPGNPVAIR